MKRALGIGLVLVAIGCGGSAGTVIRVSEAERTRSSLEGREAQTLAPQAFAEADQALRAAKDADRAGDPLGAELHAERAIASYQHAIALARLAQAADEQARAEDALGRAATQAQRFAAARKAAEREAGDLDKQLKVAREAERPAPSGPADPERERARLVAAQSLATQARLLCSAARLVSPDATGLAEAESGAADIEKKLASSPKPAPIDAAARARAACLSALTKARRAGGPSSPAGGLSSPAGGLEGDPADALLGELSRAAGAKAKGAADVTPSRDERGVVVTLRSLFRADKLSADGQAAIEELGRVAAAHPSFALQVVLHDAAPKPAAEAALDASRGEAIVKALSAGGARAAKTKVELAGARAPVFDPSDATRRAGNARVEIVFVAGR